MDRYPFGENDAENITSKTGKRLRDITLEEVLHGNVTADDIKISKEMLARQGAVSRQADNPAMAKSFERASEMVDIPDEVLLRMYNMMRPNRATKQQLLDMAQELETTYHASRCAKLVREAADIYEKRGILL